MTSAAPLTLGAAIPRKSRGCGKATVLSFLVGLAFAGMLLGDGQHSVFERPSSTTLMGLPFAAQPRMGFVTPPASHLPRFAVSAISRQTKENMIRDIKPKLEDSDLVVIARPRGMNVAETQVMREKLKDAGGNYQHVKNTLLKLALKDTKDEDLSQYLTGQNAVVYASDPVSVAKALVDIQKSLNTKDNPEKFKLSGGALTGQLLDEKGLADLSKVPGLEESRARIAQILKGQPSKIARLIKNPISKLGRAIKMGLVEKEGKEDEA